MGQTSRVGDVTLNDTAGSTGIRADFSSTSLTINSPSTFDTASAITVDTTGRQIYNGAVTLGSNLTFNSIFPAAITTSSSTQAAGIYFAQSLTPTASDLSLKVTATQSAITFGGDVGSATSRFSTLSAAGRYIIVGGGISGVVVANTLTEDPNIRVIVL